MRSSNWGNIAPTMEEFRAAERISPALAALHLVVACSWCAALAVGIALEGICFGALLLVALIRLPHTAQLYARLFRSPVFLLWAAWIAINVLSNFWAVVPVEDWFKALFPRGFFVLLALWPLAHRWSLLVAAMLAGACVPAVTTVAQAIGKGGFGMDPDWLVLGMHRSSAGPLATMGCLCLVGVMLCTRNWALWTIALAGSIIFELQVYILAGRGPALAAAVGVVLVLVRPPVFEPSIRRWITAAAVVGTIALGMAVAGSHLGDRFAQVETAARSGDSHSGASANERLIMWRATMDRVGDHLILGHGARTWSRTVGAAIAEDPERYDTDDHRARKIQRATHPHNTFLGALYSTGIVGLATFVAAAVAVMVVLWRASRAGWANTVVLGAAGVYLSYSMFDDLGSVAINGFVMSFMVFAACASVVAGFPTPRPRLQQD